MVFDGVRDRLHGGASSGVRPRSRGELLTRLGRLLLWTAVGVVVIRGLGDMLSAHPVAPAGRRAPGAPAGVWPDDAARAFAVQFATAYLSHSQGDDPVVYGRGLAAMASAEVADTLAPRYGRRAARQVVRSASVADAQRLDGRHALVTVAATVMAGHALSARQIAVPVARDSTGGLVVDALPSLAPAPARAQVEPAERESLLGVERAQIEDVLGRFLRAYLAGDQGSLSYLAVPGARLAPASERLELLSLGDVQSVGPATRDGRVVLVTVHARDARSHVAYWLGYRARMVKRDRWYVGDLNGPGVRGASR